jgi:hypothetical protein
MANARMIKLKVRDVILKPLDADKSTRLFPTLISTQTAGVLYKAKSSRRKAHLARVPSNEYGIDAQRGEFATRLLTAF